MKRRLFLFCMLNLVLWNPLAGRAQIIIEKGVSSFVLTDEGGDRMIDSLEAAGCTNLYQALLYIRSHMSSNAPVLLIGKMDALIDTLNGLTGTEEVFTVSLHDFTGGNSPVGIDADGSFIRADFSVYDYDGHPGYERYSGEQLITYATAPEYDIYMGSYEFLQGGILYVSNYHGFAVAWNDNASNINELPSADRPFLVYPNPFTDGVYIKTPETLSTIGLSDISGKSIPLPSLSSNNYLPLTDLPEGIYFLRIRSGNQSSCLKIVKRPSR